MSEPHATAWQRLTRLGPSIAMAGGLVCCAAMLIGFIAMIGLIIFGDPENPHTYYGKFSSGVCILFCVGMLIGLVGFLLLLCQDKKSNETHQTKRKET